MQQERVIAMINEAFQVGFRRSEAAESANFSIADVLRRNQSCRFIRCGDFGESHFLRVNLRARVTLG